MTLYLFKNYGIRLNLLSLIKTLDYVPNAIIFIDALNVSHFNMQYNNFFNKLDE